MCFLFVTAIIWTYIQYGSYILVPKEHLGLSEYYPEMPPDSNHIYIELPVDHHDPGLGKYKGFYLLSPGFTAKKDVIFYLTDGQQNKVNTQSDFKAFEQKLPGMSYVVMGRRGSYPALFPEVYTKDGSLDYKKAMNLYGTGQQIEDIEMVRQDLEKKGYLPSDGKIMLFGTSGAGILIQEYIAKHGEHVSKVMLEATGAPDIAIDNKIINIGSPFTEIMKIENPETLKKLEDILTKNKVDRASLCFMLYKIQLYDIDWKNSCSKLIDEIADGKKENYHKNLLNPEYNFNIIQLLMKLPIMESTKVRIFEIIGEQLIKYLDAPGDINIAFEWEKELIKEYIEKVKAGIIDVPIINLTEKRKEYGGEVLLLIGDVDNQFSVKAAEVISKAYPKSKMILVHDTHAMLQNDKKYQNLRKLFFTKGLYSEEMENEIETDTISK
jgi:hypothetical protein